MVNKIKAKDIKVLWVWLAADYFFNYYENKSKPKRSIGCCYEFYGCIVLTKIRPPERKVKKMNVAHGTTGEIQPSVGQIHNIGGKYYKVTHIQTQSKK